MAQVLGSCPRMKLHLGPETSSAAYSTQGLVQDFPLMIQAEAEGLYDSQGWQVLVPGLQADRLHLPLMQEVHGPGGEGLAQVLAPVSGESAGGAEIAPAGMILLIVLSFGAGYDQGDQFSFIFGHLDPIRAESWIFPPPSVQDPGSEPLSFVGGVCQSDERVFFIGPEAPYEIALSQLWQGSQVVELGYHLV